MLLYNITRCINLLNIDIGFCTLSGFWQKLVDIVNLKKLEYTAKFSMLHVAMLFAEVKALILTSKNPL